MQGFREEFVTRKALRHPKVLPLLGVVTRSQLAKWTSNGESNRFVTARKKANRFELAAHITTGSISFRQTAPREY